LVVRARVVGQYLVVMSFLEKSGWNTAWRGCVEETVRTRFIRKAMDTVVMGRGLFILLRLMGRLLLLVRVMVMMKMLGLLPLHMIRLDEGGRSLKSPRWLLLFMFMLFLLLLFVLRFFRQRASTTTVPMP